MAGKQPDLPGMEDRRLADLHVAAEKYVAIRDKRMALTPKEVEAKDELLALMKKHKKQTYSCDGLTIERVVTKEKVRVRIADPKDAE